MDRSTLVFLCGFALYAGCAPTGQPDEESGNTESNLDQAPSLTDGDPANESPDPANESPDPAKQSAERGREAVEALEESELQKGALPGVVNEETLGAAWQVRIRDSKAYRFKHEERDYIMIQAVTDAGTLEVIVVYDAEQLENERCLLKYAAHARVDKSRKFVWGADVAARVTMNSPFLLGLRCVR